MGKSFNIGVAGLGNIGKGVIKLLLNHDKLRLFKHRTNADFKLVAVSARDKNKYREVDLSTVNWYENAIEMAENPDIDIIVETIGGDSGIALELTKTALKNKKHVVTANKAMIAVHGLELMQLAKKNGVSVKFEASVAGGIPVIKAVKEGLAANNFTKIGGILNGTCNYILSKMQESGKDFWEILSEAQLLGYAELDPSVDIDGTDSAHKISILASIAFGNKINFSGVYVEGIRDISLMDIKYASDLGYAIKLIALAMIGNGKLCQTVYPALVPADDRVARISGANNIAFLDSDYVGKVSFIGRGAGTGPTASAILADIMDIAADRASNPFNIADEFLKDTEILDINDRIGSYYIRVTVMDRLGVMAEIADVLRVNNISIAGLIQKPQREAKDTQIIITTHPISEMAMKSAINEMCELPYVISKPRMIRIEQFE